MPLGAQEADGVDLVPRAARGQIGDGADWVKVYADYRWGPSGEPRPTFTEDEIRSVVETAASSGRDVAAHATTAEGMLRAVSAGVRTVEHGDAGTPEARAEMAARGTFLCPTLGAVDALLALRGLGRPRARAAARRLKRASFQAALAAGVPMCVGSDVGVFAHGTEARELGADGGRRDARARRAPGRDEREPGCSAWTGAWARFAPVPWPTWSPSPATRRATRRRCGASVWSSKAAASSASRNGRAAAPGVGAAARR